MRKEKDKKSRVLFGALMLLLLVGGSITISATTIDLGGSSLSNVQQITMADKNSSIELSGMKSNIIVSGVDSFLRIGKYFLEGYQAVFSGTSAQIALYAEGVGNPTTLNLYADRNKASIGTIEDKPLHLTVLNTDKIIITSTKTTSLVDLCFVNGWCLSPSGNNLGFKNPDGKIVAEINSQGRIIMPDKLITTR